MRFPTATLAVSALVLAFGCQTTTPQAPTPYLDTAGVQVIAHRGASAHAPENTLPAFELAYEMGAEWFELDCMLTADHEVIVIHDQDTKRIGGVDRPVIEQTLAELKALDAGAWYAPEYAGVTFPTLGESLDLAKGRIGVYVEIKSSDDDSALHAALWRIIQIEETMSPDLRHAVMTQIEASGTLNLPLTRKVIADIRERDMAREIVIQSFSPVVCFIVRSEAPEMRVELLGSESEDHPERWPMLVHFARIFEVHGFNAHQDSLTPERIRAFQDLGMSVAVWTVNDPERMAQFARWGVNAIITDYPDVCRQVLRETGLAANP